MPIEIEDKLHKTACIQAMPLRLLKYMWNRKVATHSDLVPYIWADQPTQSALKAGVHRANNALLKIQHVKSLSLNAGEISWK